MSRLIQTDKKSFGDSVKDTAVFLVAVGVLYMVITMIFKALIAPFKFLFMSDGQKLDAKIARAREKVSRRESLRAEYDRDESDPLNQYTNRFQLYPSYFVGDADNEKYRKWFEDFQAGKILDTNLRWAPEVYEDVDGRRSISEDFLNYFKCQLELASKKTGTSLAFLNTVRDFYPEFTPRFSTLLDEVKELRERAKSGNLYNELLAELKVRGIPEDLSEELIGMNLGPEKLRDALTTVKKCLSRGYNKAFCLYCVQNGVDTDNPFVDQARSVLNSVFEQLDDEAIVTALIPRDRSEKETERVTRLLLNLKRIMLEALDRFEDPEERKEFISYKFRELMKRKFASQVSLGR